MTLFPLVREGPLRDALSELEHAVREGSLTKEGLEKRVPGWIEVHGHEGATMLLMAVLHLDAAPVMRCTALRAVGRIALVEGRRGSARIHFAQAHAEAAGDPASLDSIIGDLLAAL